MGDEVALWLRRKRNEVGEWVVVDLRRNYRVCAFNHPTHGGPHIHHPMDGPVVAHLPDCSEMEAARVVRAYAERHERFGLEEFQKELKAWKSASNAP